MSPNWFIGFPVDPGSWYDKVITNLPAGIKCFEAEDLHITFAFLGPVAEQRALRAWQKGLTLPIRPVAYTLGPMAPFGNPKRPSAYAFTLDKGRAAVVDYMQRHANALLEIAGKEAEARPPRPHITVARPPRKASSDLRAAGMAWLESIDPPADLLCIDQMALYTWADDRKARQFKIVARRVL